MRLAGKVAVVSGAARGMGAAQAKLFAAEGAKVVIGDVLEEEGREVEAAINKSGGEGVFVSLDVTSESDWRSAVSTAVERFGKIDILVNNAGIALWGVLDDTTNEDWDRVMDVNIKGVFLGVKAVIPEMRKAGAGSIVNTGSVSALIGHHSVQPAYNASKGAVTSFTKSAAVQCAKDGIRVNAVHPGTTDTPMNASRAGGRRRPPSLIPLGRIADPMEIAYGVLYLASDEASFVTGTALVIDGGWTAR